MKTKEMVLMLLKETRFYYGEFNFELFNSDVRRLRVLMIKEKINANLLPPNPAKTIEDVRSYVDSFERIKQLYSW